MNWTVPKDHPAFAGHFPGNPILPGVVLLDHVVQFIAKTQSIALEDYAIGSVKFLSPAKPGEALTIECKALDGGAFQFTVTSGERKIAGGSLLPR
jgi:3-hydroxymyristoyl/3-hydroxydecanoyl-(acyl carrier protein) dehydratase